MNAAETAALAVVLIGVVGTIAGLIAAWRETRRKARWSHVRYRDGLNRDRAATRGRNRWGGNT